MKRFYPAWKCRQELLIASPSSTEGFQGSFILRYKPGMKRDFRDVRFCDKRGNQLSYYLELITNYSNCRAWIKLPASTTKIYMYYGNGGVTSASSGSSVFDFWDDFTTLNTSTIWTKVHGASSVSNSILTLESTTLNSILQSKSTFAVNNIVEARAYHARTNKSIIGFRNTDTELAAAWHGTVTGDTNYYDYRFTHNGSSGTWTSDAVSRGGSTYYIYGVARLTAGDKFYVNYALRGTASTTLPGSTALPIHFYSQYNQGKVCVDWVRIRKYAATEPVITLGKRYTNQPKAYPFDNAVTDTVNLGMTSDVTLKYYLNAASNLGLQPKLMLRHPLFFRTPALGPYAKWKFKGDIRVPKKETASTHYMYIPVSPGMALDGRDLRFTDTKDTVLRYYLESITNGVALVWVEVPANTTKIYYFYGKGTAVSESNSEVAHNEFTLEEVVTKVYPSAIFGHFYDWKHKGDIRISTPQTQAVQFNVDIPILPGMARDGRDLRFSNTAEAQIPYYIESVSASSIRCVVKVPAYASTICFFYGNGTATDASDPENVFDFWDDFDTLDTGEWSIVAGSAMVADSTLRVSHPTANSLLRSSTTFGTDTVLEMKMSHPNANNIIAGYWDSTNQRACWMGAHLTYVTDFMHTMDGSTQTNTNDNVNRAGSTLYKYGIAYLEAGPKFYVNDVLRGQLTTNKPTGSLPISLYSEDNEGDLVVDWVRVRKYTTATATVIRHRPRKQSVYLVEETIPVEIPIVERHYPQKNGAVPYYEYIDGKSFLGMDAADPTYKERRELRDYSLVSCDISKSTSDTFTQLSANFADLVVPPEKATVKYIARDSSGNQYILFNGKVVANSPTVGHYDSSMSMQAADNSRNLAIQKIPWNYQVINNDEFTWAMWIRNLVDSEKTGVLINTILDTDAEDTEFSFAPKTTRLEAINKIADYTNSIINIKLITRVENGYTLTRPEFFCVPPEYIDQTENGFDLPDPLILTWPDSSLVDQPKITNEQEEKYNKVIVHGVLSDTGETTVAAAYSPAVYAGEEKANEYIIEDNALVEKGSTAEREAIKWLLYFMAPRATVQLKFVERFDLELYQRIKFGSGFPASLQALTNAVQVSSVWAFDPRDEANSTHEMDVSGVPVPTWLRISEIKYHSEVADETCEVKAITDYIYSATDPVIIAPYSDYLSPGYRKPVIDDMIETTQSIVNDTVEKQLQPEICTVLSIDTENNQATVQTASGKLVTIQLPY